MAGKISIERIVASGDIAESFLNSAERELLSKYDEEIARLKRQFHTDDVDDSLCNMAFTNIPGSKEAVNKWGDISEKMRFSGKDG